MLLRNKLFSAAYLFNNCSVSVEHLCSYIRIRIGCSWIYFGSICLLVNKISNELLPSCIFLLIAVLHPDCLASFYCTVLTVAWHIFFSHLDATNEAVYELVAEPTQEQQAGEPQAEVADKPIPEEVANPADLQGKPRSITLNFSIRCLFNYLCIYVSRSCMKP